MIKSLKMNKEGLTSIYIDSGQVCSHWFVVYLDRDLRMRDYYNLDFKVNTPKTTT